MVHLAVGQMECGEREMEDMTNKFHQCSSRHKDIYMIEMEVPGAEVELVTCQLVKDLVDTCGELWSLCHQKEKVDIIKDMQLEAILTKNSDSGVSLDQCPIVQEFRERTNFTITLGPGGCSQMETQSSRELFEICSHNSTTAAYDEVEEYGSAENALAILCSALVTLKLECFPLLSSCLPQEDLIEMEKLQLEQTMGFMITVVRNRVSKQQLEECLVNMN